MFGVSGQAQRLENFFFMLSSAETKIYSAHKCEDANNCWHFNIYEQDQLLALMV